LIGSDDLRATTPRPRWGSARTAKGLHHSYP